MIQPTGTRKLKLVFAVAARSQHIVRAALQRDCDVRQLGRTRPSRGSAHPATLASRTAAHSIDVARKGADHLESPPWSIPVIPDHVEDRGGELSEAHLDRCLPNTYQPEDP